jgi:hypothetical protein
MMFSKKVFCGATRPRLPPGITTLILLIFEILVVTLSRSDQQNATILVCPVEQQQQQK